MKLTTLLSTALLALTPTVTAQTNTPSDNNRPPAHIDTVHDTPGVPPSSLVANTHHHAFCTRTPSSQAFCKTLHSFVKKCAGVTSPTPPQSALAKFRIAPNATTTSSNETSPAPFASNGTAAAVPDENDIPGCNKDAGIYLLQESIELSPCEGIEESGGDVALAKRICRAVAEAGRKCWEKKKRGPCGYHHVLWNLRKLGEFVKAGET
ncbi:hypothetical protein CC80DRAFT_493404 [Byssothecium circinans]|uniref:Uncharacterized protein n=1 Tax=Byssothecium circinans TaxID=147558 RepID=A0A6A5TQ64_9PLEO|nr:hypothetical protein CC80DRAFT_493404 [Byssothecium circinans]